MVINKNYVIERMKKNNWSQAGLARAMEVSPATVSRVLKGTRGAGRGVIVGLLKAFPDASMNELFFLDVVSTNGYSSKKTNCMKGGP